MSWRPVIRETESVVLRRALLCLALASIGRGLAAAPAALPANPSSGTVARVNGKSILRRDFDMAVQMAFRQRGPGERKHEDLQAARAAVLETLIDNELLYQKAVQAKTAVPEAEVREELERLKASIGTPDAVAAFLKENGVTEKELADQVRRSQVVRRFVDTQLPALSVFDDATARAYYDAHRDQFVRPDALRISQIIVSTVPGASPAARAAARAKAEAILAELRSGKEFSELARLHSDGAEARRGGDSGWVWAGGGALPSVERAALALQPGQTSDVVESRRGFHIIKAIERRPAGTVPFEESRERIVDQLTAERRNDKVRAYLADLRKSARIETTP